MKLEYRGRLLTVLILVEWGRTSGIDPIATLRPETKGQHLLRRELWKKSVEAIKNQPLE